MNAPSGKLVVVLRVVSVIFALLMIGGYAVFAQMRAQLDADAVVNTAPPSELTPIPGEPDQALVQASESRAAAPNSKAIPPTMVASSSKSAVIVLSAGSAESTPLPASAGPKLRLGIVAPGSKSGPVFRDLDQAEPAGISVVAASPNTSPNAPAKAVQFQQAGLPKTQKPAAAPNGQPRAPVLMMGTKSGTLSIPVAPQASPTRAPTTSNIIMSGSKTYSGATQILQGTLQPQKAATPLPAPNQ